MPEKAWGQGFTSRLIMIFSDERIIGDDFAEVEKTYSADLAHDLEIINEQIGQFEVTQAYQDAVNNWRALGEQPVPSHPKLIHYVTRRRTHLYKLSMVSAIDRSNALILTRMTSNRAMGWLLKPKPRWLKSSRPARPMPTPLRWRKSSTSLKSTTANMASANRR